MNGTVKTFGERKAHCKGTKAEQAEKIVKRAAAVIASQEGLDTKHGLTAPDIADIFMQVFGEMEKVIIGKRSLYTARKV